MLKVLKHSGYTLDESCDIIKAVSVLIEEKRYEKRKKDNN
jgi:hypothetical protein